MKKSSPLPPTSDLLKIESLRKTIKSLPSLDRIKANEIIARALGEQEQSQQPTTTTTTTSTSTDQLLPWIEVEDLSPQDVQQRIELTAKTCIERIMSDQGYHLEIPSRASSNTVYIPEVDRIVLKRGNKTIRDFGKNEREVRKLAVTTRALELVHKVLGKGIHVTKRDLFYTDVKLFKAQDESDAVLDDLACMLGCTRNALNVVASEKGVVVGRLRFREDGDEIDCTRMGVGGKAIPPFIEKITHIESDAKFILLVEKDAAFMRLAEDRFYQTWPCIILTAKGQPDVATRIFLKRLQEKLAIPVLGLVDSDPYGLKILSVYLSGSKAMSYDSASLTTSNIKWLGVRPSDLRKYNIPEQCLLPMSAADIAMGEKLLQEDFVQKNPLWCKELEMMLKTKQKAEIQALSSFGFQYLSQVFLPQKLAAGDWI
jgi:meiotic recombination protein SPO11